MDKPLGQLHKNLVVLLFPSSRGKQTSKSSNTIIIVFLLVRAMVQIAIKPHQDLLEAQDVEICEIIWAGAIEKNCEYVK